MQSDPKQPFATVLLPQQVGGERDPKKLRLLKITAPIAALVAVFGLWLTGLFLWTTVSNRNFDNGNNTAAAAGFQRQLGLTGWFPETWLAEYNLGTVRLAQGDLQEGTALLRQSYLGVPKAVRDEQGNIQPFAYECSVRMNLSAGIEMQGDALAVEGGDEEAAALYEEALEWVTPCEAGGGGQGEDESAGQAGNEGDDEQPSSGSEGNQDGQQGPQGNEAGDRLREKLGRDQDQNEGQSQGGGEGQQQGEGGGSGGNSDPFEGETPEQRERREQLEGRNQQQAERERERDESSQRGPGGGW